MSKPKVYFAHPLWSYGTEWEQERLADIKSAYPTYSVLNPNKQVHQRGYKKHGWKYFEDLVASCDALVISVGTSALAPVGYGESIYPAGCWKEAHVACTLKMKVEQIEDDWSVVLAGTPAFPLLLNTVPMTVSDTSTLNRRISSAQSAYVLTDRGHGSLCEALGMSDTMLSAT